jgi:hypothetical protein
MLENLPRLLASLHLDSFVSWDKVYVGLRADALAPCFLLCHLDNFIDTKPSALSRDWQKTRHRDPSPPTGGSGQAPTAPN